MRALVRDTFRSYLRHGGSLLGGATAFFAVLSAAPLLLLMLALAAPLAGTDRARAELLRGLRMWLGAEGARTVSAMLDNAHASGSGVLAGLLGGAVMVYGATRLFSALQRALNHMWDVRARDASDLRGRAWRLVRKRLLAFVMVLACGVVLLASMLLRATVTAAGEVLPGDLPDALHVVDHGLTFVVVAALFALVFKVLPDVRLAWRDALAGATVTALLFSAGKSLVGLYLGHKSLGSTFGAAGSLVALLLWVHYSAQIFFLGAAFTAVYARHRGRPLAPTEYAIHVHALDEEE